MLGQSRVRLKGLIVAVARVRARPAEVQRDAQGMPSQLVCEVIVNKSRKTPISHFSPIQFG